MMGCCTGCRISEARNFGLENPILLKISQISMKHQVINLEAFQIYVEDLGEYDMKPSPP